MYFFVDEKVLLPSFLEGEILQCS